MKIIIAAKCVHPFHPFGGIQKYVYYFAKALAGKGVDVHIVAPLDDGKPRSESRDGLTYTLIRPRIQKYLEYPIGWLGVHLFSIALARYLRKQEFDLLHAFDVVSYRYLKTASRKPVVAQVFTDNYLTNPIASTDASSLTASSFEKIKQPKVKISPFSEDSIKRRYFLQYLFKVKPMYRCLTRCERLFVESDFVREEINELYKLGRANGAVVPVGVDIKAINRSIGRSALTREALGLRDDDVVLITVNRLAADKGIDRIILAMDKLEKNVPKIKLVVIGNGYQENELTAIVKERKLSDRVLFFKNVPEDDLYKYYALSDLYVCAFSFLGSSISTLEAMACGLPVITTAQPWLIKDGQNGLMIKDNSAETIQKAVEQIVHKGRLKEMGEVSRGIVGDYDWGRIADLAIEQYGRIIHVD